MVLVFTVNEVIFAGGKFRENVGKTFSRGGNFHETTTISFIKAYGLYFCMGVIFANKTEVQKITPTRKFPCLQYWILNRYYINYSV